MKRTVSVCRVNKTLTTVQDNTVSTIYCHHCGGRRQAIDGKAVTCTCERAMIHCDHCGMTEHRMERAILAWHWNTVQHPICCETPAIPSVLCRHLTTVANSAGSPVCQECGQSW